MGSKARILTLSVLLVLAAGALAAETFTVTLDNGTTFVTRYKPKLAADGATVYLLTEVGNWIAFERASVVDVVSDLESRGYGLVIDTTTISLGIAPNTRQAGEEAGGTLDANLALLNYLRERDAQMQSYSVPQFVEPEETSGIPVSYTQQVTPPIGYRPPK